MQSGVSRGRLAGGRLSQPRCAWECGESGTQRGPDLRRERVPSPRSVLTVPALAAACRHGHAGHTAGLSSAGSSLSLSRVLARWGVVPADHRSRRRSCGVRAGPCAATCESEHFLPSPAVPGEVTFPPLEVPSERRQPQAGKGAGTGPPPRLGFAVVFRGGPAPQVRSPARAHPCPVLTPSAHADTTRRTRAPAHPPPRPRAPASAPGSEQMLGGQPPVSNTLSSPRHGRRGRTEKVMAGDGPRCTATLHVTVSGQRAGPCTPNAAPVAAS